MRPVEDMRELRDTIIDLVLDRLEASPDASPLADQVGACVVVTDVLAVLIACIPVAEARHSLIARVASELGAKVGIHIKAMDEEDARPRRLNS